MKAVLARLKLPFAALLCGLLATTSVSAAVISWTDWTARTVAASGSATGTITLPSSSTIGVSYAGQVIAQTNVGDTGNPSWLPASTYADGSVVDNAPPVGNLIALQGGNTNVNTLTFSAPVVDPVVAIWSLGQPGLPASFVFANATPTFVKGGPSQEFAGSAITVSGNTVNGIEGNGTVQFVGTFDSLSWTNPTAEFYYGFTVGVAGAVPEPSEYVMLLAGLALLGFAARRRAGGDS